VRLSTHYYVLSLSTMKNALFEAFRDSLIDVENQGFPVSGPACGSEAVGQEQRCDLARTVDGYFGRYYAREPLRLVVVGAPEMQVAFSSVTAHGAAVVGRIEGDHTTTSVRDLGQIVWPVVKEAMSGVLGRTMHDLEDFAGRGRLALGLEAVVRAAGHEARAMLLVEEDYRWRGNIWKLSDPPVMTTNVDVRDAIDDVVDAVIDKVLESAGSVVFTRPGALRDQGQIALLLRGAEDL
jgi:hypothetical protein